MNKHPLDWPVGWKRTDPRDRSQARYGVSGGRARDDLLLELSRMGADHVVLSTNVPLRRDGLPYANAHEPDDPGVAVYWTGKDGAPHVIACDTWRTVRENMRAIGLTISALRMIRRAGATEIEARAYLGFAALPANAGQSRPWREVLGADDAKSADDVRRVYRRAAAEAHPDKGGDREVWEEINQAFENALRELGG
jgi:hypothetical protein